MMIEWVASNLLLERVNREKESASNDRFPRPATSKDLQDWQQFSRFLVDNLYKDGTQHIRERKGNNIPTEWQDTTRPYQK
jgi:hypothetical protein